jgi:hypothetical protein
VPADPEKRTRENGREILMKRRSGIGDGEVRRAQVIALEDWQGLALRMRGLARPHGT